jgi:hypothetical protein
VEAGEAIQPIASPVQQHLCQPFHPLLFTLNEANPHSHEWVRFVCGAPQPSSESARAHFPR